MAKHTMVVNIKSVCVDMSEVAYKEYRKLGYVPFNTLGKVLKKLKEIRDEGDTFIESVEEV